MSLSENQIKSLSSLLHCPDLVVLMNPAWGSHNPEHRQLIHAERAKRNAEGLLCSSLSHAPSMGVLVLSSKPVGVDVEESNRVEGKVVGRVSSAEELAQASTPASLWCAKEAAFKALKMYNQPSVISKISIGLWSNIDSQTETFQMLNPQEFSAPTANHGVVIKNASLTLSFFTFSA